MKFGTRGDGFRSPPLQGADANYQGVVGNAAATIRAFPRLSEAITN